MAQRMAAPRVAGWVDSRDDSTKAAMWVVWVVL